MIPFLSIVPSEKLTETLTWLAIRTTNIKTELNWIFFFFDILYRIKVKRQQTQILQKRFVFDIKWQLRGNSIASCYFENLPSCQYKNSTGTNGALYRKLFVLLFSECVIILIIVLGTNICSCIGRSKSTWKMFRNPRKCIWIEIIWFYYK